MVFKCAVLLLIVLILFSIRSGFGDETDKDEDDNQTPIDRR